MSQVIIENPVINSPFDEPKRHFRFSDEGITNEIVESLSPHRVLATDAERPATESEGQKQSTTGSLKR